MLIISRIVILTTILFTHLIFLSTLKVLSIIIPITVGVYTPEDATDSYFRFSITICYYINVMNIYVE